MTPNEQKKAAAAFVEKWKDRGDEKQETALFWIELLGNVLGVENPTSYIEFEKPVIVEKNQKYIDGYIPSVKILIEQKGSHIKLGKTAVQSDGEKLTPYGQAFRYNNYLPYEQKAKWIIVSNFTEILIYDQNKPNGEPEIIFLKDLPKEYYRLQFLVASGSELLKKEMEISLKAGEIVGVLYDALLKQYADPTAPETLQSLNKLCVRLVFCFYAEDSGIFGKQMMFHDYMKQFDAKSARKGLIELFRVLDMTQTQREDYDKYMDKDLAAFPYVNGGLFADESIEIPPLTDEIMDLILRKASEDFDWSGISPTIFGAVFESTLNPETRRSGGMHYTSIENIHKVIDPLFLDDLNKEFEEIKDVKRSKDGISRMKLLEHFHTKISSLSFLDPACGSGNFLTESFLSLRKIENELIVIEQDLIAGQHMLTTELSPVKVSIHQFYGIEINDFAVSVAKTALWIAELQMMQKTQELLPDFVFEFLPLKDFDNIKEGNALQIDWANVVSKDKLSYITGNPPFIGFTYQSQAQKKDILSIYVDEEGKPYKASGKLDYVAGWYFKAAQLMEGTNIKTAFVSTNSITQGEQVSGVWQPLYDRFKIHIDFAHRTFRWDSEASIKAHVHCVIIGFSVANNNADKRLFDNGAEKKVKNINAYLMGADNLFIESRRIAISSVPEITKGFQATDNGFLILSEDEKNELLCKEPEAKKWIRPYSMGFEFINNVPRYCLWLVGIEPNELNKLPYIKKRVANCREYRCNAPKTGDAYKLKDIPHLFRPCKQFKDVPYIAIPLVSSEQKRYMPMGFIYNGMIPGNNLFCIFNAGLYHFGILTSNVHMAWMRAIGGRLKSDPRYSKDLVYNNFPWCNPTPEQKAKIEKTAQMILDARSEHPDCSLADLYDELTMPADLRKAHQANDRAVMEAYGFWGKLNSESECVAELMKMYQKLVEQENSKERK